MSEESAPKKPWLPSWARKSLLGVSGVLEKMAGPGESSAVEPDGAVPAIANQSGKAPAAAPPAAAPKAPRRASKMGPVMGFSSGSSARLPVEGKPVGKNPTRLDSGPAQDRPSPSPTGKRSGRTKSEGEEQPKRIAYVTDIEGNWECAAPPHTPAPPPPPPPAPPAITEVLRGARPTMTYLP